MPEWKVNSGSLGRKGGVLAGMVAGLFVCLLVAGLFVIPGCVETAECNESVRCSEGTICYDYRCRPRCDGAATCPRGEICRPCVDPSTEQNHCVGQRGSACLPESE